MPMEIWDLREVKRALVTYCNDNQLDPGGEIALDAADKLLEFAREPLVNHDRLPSRLRDDGADPAARRPGESMTSHRRSLRLPANSTIDD